MVRTYARIVGVLLIVLGGACMLGVGTTSPVVDLAHLFLGSIFAYIGFGSGDTRFARGMVGGLGVICLLGGVALTLVLPALFGAFPRTGIGVDLLHMVLLVLGVLSIAVAALPERSSAARP